MARATVAILVAVVAPGVICLTACRGTSPGAVAAEVGTAAAVSAASAAMQARPGGVETSNLTADLNDPPPSRPEMLDVVHTRAVLIETDLRTCWPKGARREPRDVQVTFRNDGTVTRVAVPRPNGGVAYDEACVAAKLKDVIVDPFMGADVIVGFTTGEP